MPALSSSSFPPDLSGTCRAGSSPADAGTANPPKAPGNHARMVRRRGVPLDRMWQDAEHWLPPALAGETIDVVVVLNEDNETVASVRIPRR